MDQRSSGPIGRPMPRVEDFRLVTGHGRFSDDVDRPGQAHAVMVRAPVANARIEAIETADALAVPGALAVLTGADAAADGLALIPHATVPSSPPDIRIANSDGSEHFVPPHEVIPRARVRHVGEAVAVAVAETLDAARDAAERVVVSYAELPAVTGTGRAAGGPAVWEEHGSNICIDGEVGDAEATDRAFAGAHAVVTLETALSRCTGVPMEPRSAVGAYDPASGRYSLHAGGGGVVRYKIDLAAVLGVDVEAVRVTANDVGGSYGTRNALYPEFPIVLWAARRVGCPVKWTGDRTEMFLTDFQARDLAVEAALALDAEGRFLGLRISNVSNIGAHAVSFIPLIKGVEIFPLTYRIGACHARARAVASNTPPTYPYRSAGRPEVTYAMERLIDIAADRLGMDRLEIRRRNIAPAEAIPYFNGLGLTFDSGDFPAAMERAVALSGWPGEAGAEAADGRLRGIGIATYIDLATGAPHERTEIEILPEGRVEVVIGTQDSGQGHETAFGQMVAEMLSVDFETIRFTLGDTDVVSVGGGSNSGRSMRLGATILSEASGEIVAKGSEIAAHVLEAARADIEYRDGSFTVVGTDRSIGLFEAARAARERDDLPDSLKGRLAAAAEIESRKPAFGSGCHVCEVEIDPETGAVEIVRWTAVDDVGRAINPLLIDGQTHGAVVQGIGQALSERCVYEEGTGQLLSASFMDYAMPRADSVPSFATALQEVPAPTNPLGVKPGSEGGTAVSPAAVANAVVDALKPLGVHHIDLPATPERVWRAIRDAAAG
ncbi:MAG: xanthine dehydrogenase family protein molybdopterin-binding subunit [Defluviicoccus sp.]|nr:xanthine dehydrogenase family protein molybdopterin-binding subunit [Defluviicoccus sp.]MDE0383311.1 xanthine dehydrogenase family protein molybdopterin-binding subunit [Defluviicoccus sp.]